MKVTKNYLNKIFEESLSEFNDKIFKVVDKVELEFINKEVFLESAKDNSFIKMQIDSGLFKDFDKEYPNFLVVFKYNKDKTRRFLGLPMKISICDEIAKDKLKILTSNEIKAFLRFAFIHEITHIYEHDLMEVYPDLWAKSLASYGDEVTATEDFVEAVIEMLIPDKSLSDKAAEKLWSFLLIRAKRMQK